MLIQNNVVLQSSDSNHISSISAQLNYHLRGCCAGVLPEAALTGSDVSHVTGRGPDRNRKWSRAHAEPVHFVLLP